MKLIIPAPVLVIVQTLEAAGFEAFVVGGAVRDLLVRKEHIRDWDVTTNATPEELQKLFLDSVYDNAFGTVMVAPKHIAKQFGMDVDEEAYDVFDLTTYRTESDYSDKRRPSTVAWGNSLEEDLKRRDFTINAMALRCAQGKRNDTKVECELIDPFNGQEDLDSKLIRAVGDANERFDEDALRMMRAIRFGSQLGFLIETNTLSALQKNAELITNISWERIRDEFLKIVLADYAADGVRLLHSAGLLAHIMPELLTTRGVQQAGRHKLDVWGHSLESLQECPSTDPVVRLAALLHDIGKPKTQRFQGPRGVTFYGHEVVGARMARVIGQRLRLSKKQVEKLFILVRWHMFTYEPHMTDAAIRRFIKRVGVENINDMMLLRVGDRKGGGSKATSWRLRELQQRVGEQLYEPMSTRDLKIDGNDVMKILHMKPGPRVGDIMNQLFDEVMEDTSRNTRKYLMRRVKELGND